MRVSTIKGYSQFQKYTGVDNNENQRMLSPNSSVSFKGHKYPSGEYTDEEVAIAKRFINQIGDSWKQTFKKENTKSFGELYLNSHGLNYPLSYVGDFIAAAVDDTDDYLYMTRKEKAEMTRLVNNVGTLGVFEVLNSPVSATEAGIRKLSENHKINKQTVRIAMLINDMKAEEEAKGYKSQYDNLTNQIEDVRKQKYDLLNNADLPLPELSIEDNEKELGNKT